MNVVITGCSRGIGFELVKLFSKENKVICLSRNGDSIMELINNGRSNNIKYIPLDFLNKNENDVVNKSLLDDGIDILIHNAGFLINKPFLEISATELQQVYEVNVLGPFRLTQALMPYMNNNSHIINVSSMGGVQGSVKFPGLSSYSSSKGALSILTECLAEEFKDKPVHINCLALGAVQTEMLEMAFPGYVAPVTPESMAGFIMNFAINTGQFINGKIIPVSLSTP